MKILAAFLSLVLLASAHAQRVSPLAERPKWSELEKYQESITREDFLYLLDEVYAPGGAWKPFIEASATSATIQTGGKARPFVLRFASKNEAIKPAARFWRQKTQMPPRPSNKPLQGIRIAIDPGHIGGQWAQMEERWFRIGDSKPVTEGNMTLYVAKLLVPRLKALGAQVSLTRNKPAPVTSLRPEKLADEARTSLEADGDRITTSAVHTEAERLFYRVGEIHQRAELVNGKLKPDLVLCLHFNAEAWGNASHPTLTDVNHLHLLVTGAFSGKELAYEDQRFNMLDKLLSRAYPEELAISNAVAASMSKATGLPPYVYHGGNAVKVGSNPYVWGRNLLANRLFQCPVVYVEPYVMNNREVFARLQAADYDGKRLFGGKLKESIYREYADGIVRGLVDYYTNPR